MNVRKYKPEDIPAMLAIWNKVVEAGDAFPQEELLDEETGAKFFVEQSRTAVVNISRLGNHRFTKGNRKFTCGNRS